MARVPRDASVNSPISSLVSAAEATAAAVAAAAALAPRPPGPQAGRCWLPPQSLVPSRDLVAAAAGSRLRGRRGPGPAPIPASRPTSSPSHGPGTASWLHPGPRRGGGAPREARVGREGCRGETRAWRAEVLAPAGFRGLGPRPTPHRSLLPSVRCAALGRRTGALELRVPLTVRLLCACALVASSEVRKRACVRRYCLLPVTEKWQLPKPGSSLLGCCGQAGLACLRR